MSHITVVLADDHPAVLAGIRSAIDKAADIEVVGCAERGEEALRMIQTLHPEVAVLDCRLCIASDENGISPPQR